MPSRRAVQKKLRAPEWEVSSFMMDRALEAVVRQISKLDRDHDIPYLAGYSKNGKTIYIDRHMPKSFSFRRRRVKTDRFLILHEAVEKTLMDHLGLRYLHAHQIATRAEQAAVRAAGISWDAYDRFMRIYVKSIGDERLGNARSRSQAHRRQMCSTNTSKGQCVWGFAPIACVIGADRQRRKTAPLKRLPTLSLEARGHQSGRGGPARSQWQITGGIGR